MRVCLVGCSFSLKPILGHKLKKLKLGHHIGSSHQLTFSRSQESAVQSGRAPEIPVASYCGSACPLNIWWFERPLVSWHSISLTFHRSPCQVFVQAQNLLLSEIKNSWQMDVHPEHLFSVEMYIQTNTRAYIYIYIYLLMANPIQISMFHGMNFFLQVYINLCVEV